MDAPKGELLEAVEMADAPKEKPVEDDELNVEPNGELLGCHVEEPNKPVLVPPLELLELAAEDEAEAPSPKVEPELKIFVAGLEEENNEPPEEKDEFVAALEEVKKELPEEAVLSVNPKDGIAADEPNEPTEGKAVPVAVADEVNKELPEEPALPVNPKDGDDPDEPNKLPEVKPVLVVPALDEVNKELPEEVVLPANPKDGVDADEPNERGWLCVEAAN